MTDEILRALVDLRDRQMQKARIQFGNRVSAIERQDDDPAGSEQYKLAKRWHKRFAEIEKDLDRDIKRLVKNEAIYEYMIAVKGIGPLMAAKLIAMIDISRSDTTSSLWRFAGYAVFDGERERPTKGEKLHYNKRLKTTCYLIGGSFLKTGSPYRAIYDEARVHYAEKRPEWTDGHCHNAAMRRMVKRFLSHLWLVWRSIEGLPTRSPYVEEYLGHTHIDQPADYGWDWQPPS